MAANLPLAPRLRDALLARTRAVPVSSVSRLFRTGHAAGAMATAVLGGRLRSRGDGLAAAELEDLTKLVGRLGELKGVAMKAGQLMSYVDATLPDELRGLLSVLQTASPASPRPAIEAALREAFGARAEVLLAAMDPDPVAVASIGQVHRANVDGVELAIKVRHPGIEAALAHDFGVAQAGSVFARALMPAGGKSLRGLIDEARTAMLEECDLALEADRQEAFARRLAGHPVLRVPRVERTWCAPNVLATRWTPGLSLDQWLATKPSQAARDRAGVALFELYVGSLYAHGVFHADPHPGNYAFREDGTIVVYDFGCVRSFDRETVGALAALAAAVRADDGAAIDDAFVALGASRPSSPAARAHLRRLLRGFFAPLLVRGSRAVEPGAGLDGRAVLRDKMALAGLSLPGKLLFLFRIRFGLYAVLSRLGSVADWGALESAWARGDGVRSSSTATAP
jgi:predicted unusual protein kinase regulating ubiquinone biosynthesis (AarF/ABC1/UbiB family)